MIRVESAYFPEKYKTKNSFQWIGYIKSQLKEMRGLDKHKNNNG